MNRLFVSMGVLGFVLIGVIVAFLSFNRQAGQSQVLSRETVSTAVVASTGSERYQPQEAQFGQVGVTITPQQLMPGQQIVFSVALDTHSVDLAYDFNRVVALKDETGKGYQFLEWTGDNGGHHLSGELVFEPLSAETKSLTLTLSGIENQSHEFTWETVPSE